MWDLIDHHLWAFLAVPIALAAALAASAHAVLYKRDSRSVVSWVGLIWLVPFAGAALYVLLGINRISRRARKKRGGGPAQRKAAALQTGKDLSRLFGEDAAHLEDLARLGERLLDRPLLAGNRVEPLEGGNAAFGAMIEAIDGATGTVALSSYIFDGDPAGRMFLDALSRAARRGVAVRVLVDDVGIRYSFPAMDRALRAAGVPTARFLPALLHWKMPYFNLRLHRKLLVVDGRVGFTGGMNVREGHMLSPSPRHPIQDLHFRLRGPVVAQLMEVFAEDWSFTTGEELVGEDWFPSLEPAGDSLARGIRSGPDEDYRATRWILEGALSCAHRRVQIVTPYFLPDAGLVSALNVAALRGVELDILLPSRNNLTLVHWASRAQWWQVLEHGCRISLTAPPFDHSKLMIVDEAWVLFGSANWDPRSLRLNFEFDVECYDRALAAELGAVLERKRLGAKVVSLAELNARSLPRRLRDGVARILTPFL